MPHISKNFFISVQRSLSERSVVSRIMALIEGTVDYFLELLHDFEESEAIQWGEADGTAGLQNTGLQAPKSSRHSESLNPISLVEFFIFSYVRQMEG